MNTVEPLPVSASASTTIRSSAGAYGAVQGPAAHSASALPFAILCSVGLPSKVSSYGFRPATETDVSHRTRALWGTANTRHT